MTATYSAPSPAIHCEGCANSIRNVLGKMPGVQNIEVDVNSKQVTVEYDANQMNEARIEERLTRAGFPPERR